MSRLGQVSLTKPTYRRIVLRCCSVPQAKPSPDYECRISLRPHPVAIPLRAHGILQAGRSRPRYAPGATGIGKLENGRPKAISEVARLRRSLPDPDPENRAAISIRSARPPIITVIGASPVDARLKCHPLPTRDDTDRGLSSEPRSGRGANGRIIVAAARDPAYEKPTAAEAAARRGRLRNYLARGTPRPRSLQHCDNAVSLRRSWLVLDRFGTPRRPLLRCLSIEDFAGVLQRRHPGQLLEVIHRGCCSILCGGIALARLQDPPEGAPKASRRAIKRVFGWAILHILDLVPRALFVGDDQLGGRKGLIPPDVALLEPVAPARQAPFAGNIWLPNARPGPMHRAMRRACRRGRPAR
jgi:hypothetical protein